MKKNDPPADTLTPQRKHRKLLKDGSGIEVWPESIEKTFVQGLREYWQSPYATYSQSRGRSRWRNQFLVDYLQRNGIQRTKKQVASHIQVLRNMWKGQPEFHLVAGGDEIVDPVTHIPIKEEVDTNNLIPIDWDESSTHSASPDFSPPDSHSDFPLTPEQRPNLYPDAPLSIKHEGSPGRLYPFSSPSTSPLNDNYGLPSGEYSPTHPPASKPLPSNYPPYSTQSASPTPTSFPRYVHNRITTFFLCADGMTPFSVNVDALAQSAPSPRHAFTLRIKLSVPVLNDARSPPSLHGFTAGVTVANLWSVSAKCTTKVYAGNSLVSEEHENAQMSQINSNGTVNALFPDSSLTRCRWLDHNVPTIVTQELAIDDLPLLFLIYELDRKNGPMPCSEFLGFQHYKLPEKTSSSSNSQSPSSYNAAASRRMSQFPSSYTLPSNSYSIPSR